MRVPQDPAVGAMLLGGWMTCSCSATGDAQRAALFQRVLAQIWRRSVDLIRGSEGFPEDMERQVEQEVRRLLIKMQGSDIDQVLASWAASDGARSEVRASVPVLIIAFVRVLVSSCANRHRRKRVCAGNLCACISREDLCTRRQRSRPGSGGKSLSD